MAVHEFSVDELDALLKEASGAHESMEGALGCISGPAFALCGRVQLQQSPSGVTEVGDVGSARVDVLPPFAGG